MNPDVDNYLERINTWQEELKLLRQIILDCGLTEEYKWKSPCYTINRKNVLLLHNFKDYCAIGFFKGALLKDTDKILEKPGDNSNSSRLIKFTAAEDIKQEKDIIKSYIFQAVDVEKAGLKVKVKKVSDYEFPEELQAKIDSDITFKEAFESLTPGRQKGYILFISGAKQAKTRASRVEKYVDRILAGHGIHDCTCGLSKRYPTCDGSHKNLK